MSHVTSGSLNVIHSGTSGPRCPNAASAYATKSRTTLLLLKPPYASCSACGRSQWKSVTMGSMCAALRCVGSRCVCVCVLLSVVFSVLFGVCVVQCVAQCACLVCCPLCCSVR
jgi:hypothetical protein